MAGNTVLWSEYMDFTNGEIVESPTEPPPSNSAPIADFSISCENLVCQFANSSTDSDGDALSFLWDFGDGSAQVNSQNPSHTFTAEGSYFVTLTASDQLNSSVLTTEVSVTSPPPPPPPQPQQIVITNIVHDLNKKGKNRYNIYWEGATTENVRIYINNKKYRLTENDGHRRLHRKYKLKQIHICNDDGSSCSEPYLFSQ